MTAQMNNTRNTNKENEKALIRPHQAYSFEGPLRVFVDCNNHTSPNSPEGDRYIIHISPLPELIIPQLESDTIITLI